MGRHRRALRVGSRWSRGVGLRPTCRRIRWSRSAGRRPGRRCFGWSGCIVSCSSGAGRGAGAMASGNATTFRAIDALAWSASCRFGLLLTNGGVGVPSAPSLSCVVVREVCRMAHPRADSAANGPKRQRPGASQQAPGISTATRVPGARHDRICVAGEHSSPAPPCAAAAALTVDLESASGARHGRARRRRPGGVAVGWVSRWRGGSAVSRAWRTPADPGLVVWTGEPGIRLVWTSAADGTRAQSPH